MWTIWCMVLYFFGARAEINQPSILVLKEDENTTLTCSQNDNHNYMSWYLQRPGKGLQLIYYSVGENQENKGDIHTGYEAKRLTKQVFRSDIISVKKNHSAIYFCASSPGGSYSNMIFGDGTKLTVIGDHKLMYFVFHCLLVPHEGGLVQKLCQRTDSSREVLMQLQNSVNNERLIFGTGTKLTVLGKNSEIIEPDVVIFSPSKQEIQEKKKATLVCLASGFFPDHLNLVWKVNGVKRTEGVGTDEISTSNGSTYSLTSRLRTSAQEWFNPLNRFECIANFFKNGTQQSIQKIIYGDTGCDIFKENYQRSATAGKFVYIMLIFKSILYGIFVMGMMLWYKKMY
nr:T cell receptor beta [Gallus gallus]